LDVPVRAGSFVGPRLTATVEPYGPFGTGTPGSVSLGVVELTFSRNGKMPGSGVPHTRWIGVSIHPGVHPNPRQKIGAEALYHPVLVWGVRLASARGFRVGIVSSACWATSMEDARVWLSPFVGAYDPDAHPVAGKAQDQRTAAGWPAISRAARPGMPGSRAPPRPAGRSGPRVPRRRSAPAYRWEAGWLSPGCGPGRRCQHRPSG
jgi:hypothetical protein